MSFSSYQKKLWTRKLKEYYPRQSADSKNTADLRLQVDASTDHTQYILVCQLGFISITRYRDIDRGVGDLAIIAAPRHRTISPTKASLTSALLNSSHRTHSAIIIARTVTGHHLKGPDRRPVGDRAPPRDRAVQHTQ